MLSILIQFCTTNHIHFIGLPIFLPLFSSLPIVVSSQEKQFFTWKGSLLKTRLVPIYIYTERRWVVTGRLWQIDLIVRCVGNQCRLRIQTEDKFDIRPPIVRYFYLFCPSRDFNSRSPEPQFTCENLNMFLDLRTLRLVEFKFSSEISCFSLVFYYILFCGNLLFLANYIMQKYLQD